jgi:polysaccharide pyruvyl transferase WcaK-like protein
MRILVDPGTFDCLNLGDLAALQVAISRLRELWPTARIDVLTMDPAALLRHCPDVQPVIHLGRLTWSSERSLLGRYHRTLSQTVSDRLISLKRMVRHHQPALLESLIRLKMKLRRLEDRDFEAFLEAMHEADLLILSGMGTFTDTATSLCDVMLDTLELAIHCGTPTAMFSQGVGPIHDPELLSRSRDVLPRVDLIALREAQLSLSLLKSLGVAPSRMPITGDDAVELAYELRTRTSGAGIGVNLRVAKNAGVDLSAIDEIRSTIQDHAKKYSAPLFPVPIALHCASRDPQIIQQLLRGYDDSSDGGRSLDTTQKVIEQVGRCRVVVTGAYHAAVFAVAQGVPVVCLTRSEYYRAKFVGLADLFGCGVQIVYVGGEDFTQRLNAAIDNAWRSADELRVPLLAASERQIVAAWTAYRKVYSLVLSRRTAA